MVCEGAPEVRIGKKSILSYVLAILMNLTDQGANKVVVKARGRNINKAVDAVEIVRNRLAKGVNIKVEACEIGSQEITVPPQQPGEQPRTRRVSSIEICLSKEA